MKNLLFICLLFSTVSAHAMDDPDVRDKPLKFYRLSKDEIPKQNYIIELEAKIIPCQIPNYAQKENRSADANCLPAKTCSLPKAKYYPSLKKELEIHFIPGQGLPSFINKNDEVLDYIFKHCYHSEKAKKLQFEEETETTLSCYRTIKDRKRIGEEIKGCTAAVQKQGEDKLFEKNAHLAAWINQFIDEWNPNQTYYSVHKKTFVSAVKLLHAAYGGKISILPATESEVYLKAKVCGEKLRLPMRRDKEARCLHEYRMITVFKDFLKKCGYYRPIGRDDTDIKDR